jgi:hypothetical protein
MDAKANYPENGKPTSQRGLNLGAAEGLAGSLPEVDSVNGLVQGIVEFHRDESICERDCSGESHKNPCRPNWESQESYDRSHYFIVSHLRDPCLSTT